MRCACCQWVDDVSWQDLGAALIGCPSAHVARKLRRQLGTWARDRGHQLIWVEATDDDVLIDRLARAADALSPLERRDCRVLLLADRAELFRYQPPEGASPDWSLLGRAFAAESLAVILARYRDRWLIDLLREDRLTFHYQPVIDATTGRAFGYECLLRGIDAGGGPASAEVPTSRDPAASSGEGSTRRDEGGTIGPVTMLTAAQRMGLLHALDQAARTKAVASAPVVAMGPSARLFVNVLPQTVYDPAHCLQPMFEAAQAAGLAPGQLVLEVSGAAGQADENHLRGLFDFVRSRGWAVCIDDLGGGPEGLLGLVHLETDLVKLDMQRVDGRTDRLAENLVQIARDRGIRVIAECVEQPEQLRQALGIGVDLVQGRLLCEPAAQLPPRGRQSNWLARISQFRAATGSARQPQSVQPQR